MKRTFGMPTNRPRRRTKLPRVVQRPAALLSLLLAGALAATALAGCGGDSEAAAGGGGEQTEIRYQGWVGQVTYPELAEALGYLPGLKLKWIGNTISGPQDIQATATGDTDIGGAFNGAVVKLVSAGAPIKAVVGYYGVDKDAYNGYYVLDGSPIKGPRDLIGKKVGMNTLGAHAEAVLGTYLKQGGLTPDEIKQVIPTVVPPVNTEQALRAKQIEVAVLGGILRDKALQRGGITPLFTDHELFGDFTAGTQVLRTDFIEKNPTTTKTLVSGIAKAVAWTQERPRAEVIAKYQEIIDSRGRDEDRTLSELWKSAGVAGKGGVIADREFVTWIEWLQQNGQLTKDVNPKDLYTNEFNPYAEEVS